MLAAGASLIDVEFAACTVLAQAGETAVLCGGSAAAYYVPDDYQSLDVDFMLHVGQARHTVDRALATLGYERVTEGFYEHPVLPYALEFPVGPLAIGREEVGSWRTDRRAHELLHVLTPTDVVRDRFLHYWAWKDESAFRVALAVARAKPREVDLDAVRAWALRELAADRTYDPEEIDRFFNALAGG
ncbi:MAG: hypothetical protein ABSD03_02380 [Vulcanimicrobiaceae bacterium]|jgi:hypothetical protein